MKCGPDIALIASLIGDPARANMLLALMNGCALTAGELAEEAGVTPPTASTHLAKLRSGGLIAERKDGRNRYFSIAGNTVAGGVETLMNIAEQLGHVRQRPSSNAPALKCSRVCYNHLAGTLAVWMFTRLRERKLISGRDAGLRLTRKGGAFVSGFGIDIEALQSPRQPLCRPCRDWSEQSDHLGGLLGAAFLDRFFALNWASRKAGTRIIRFSLAGEQQFRALFGG